jgi:nicotinate phosphoribosyltransferase
VRELDAGGIAVAERVTDTAPGPGQGRPLLRQLVRGGEITGREPIADARARHAAAVAELPSHARQLSRGYPAIPTTFTPDRDEAAALA